MDPHCLVDLPAILHLRSSILDLLFSSRLIELLRTRLGAVDFHNRYRCRPEDFTRERCLTFSVVMLLILQKTVKSVQRHLHEFLAELARGTAWTPVTSSAWRTSSS